MDFGVSEFKLTFPKACAEYVKSRYLESEVILEYGSGGSTFIATNAKKTIVSVESDRSWLENLSERINQKQKNAFFHPIWVDIGETENWGYPDNETNWRGWHKYPISPWQYCLERNISPDLVLIDGRFRVATFIASCVYTTKPLTILFDDFADRPHYHHVRRFAEPIEIVDKRLAVFSISPGLLEAKHLLESFAFFNDQE